jgi:hypothetical protein
MDDEMRCSKEGPSARFDASTEDWLNKGHERGLCDRSRRPRLK